MGKHVEASQKLIENYTKVQEFFQQKQADYQDEKQKEYQAKVSLSSKNQMLIKNPSKLYFQGYFDENMELIPKVPKSPQEIEYEILEGRFGSTIASGMQKFLSWATLNLPLIYSNCIIMKLFS